MILFLLFTITLWAGCVSTEDKQTASSTFTVQPAGTPLTIWVATDLHYLAEDLTDAGPFFQSTMQNGDGKLTERTPEILDEFITQVLAARPHALVISGDLTFNGERQSLREMADRLTAVQEAGIPVLVIPGNHDIDYPLAFNYEGDSYTVVENITMDSFREICGQFGYDGAVACDKSSFSYVYELAEDVQLLFLDGNTSETPGSIGEGTMTWTEEQLQTAQKDGKTVLSVSHQNVLPQNQLLYYDFALYNYEEVSALLQEYGVTANFSGHSHIQHISRENALKDYATGPLSVSPLRYGIITIDENRNISYEMTSLSETAPASETVAALAEQALERYNDCNRRQILAALEEMQQEAGFSREDLETMAAFVLEVNRAYFSGTLSGQQEYLASEAWALWTQYGQENFWWHYMNLILQEEPVE